MVLQQLRLGGGFNELIFRYKDCKADFTAIYTAYSEEHEVCVYLHVNAAGFEVYLADCEYITEAPAYGWGTTPEAAYAEAIKSLLDLPHGYVTHEREDDDLIF